jgi:asparagine synthase (glutamine-hydrolysing)
LSRKVREEGYKVVLTGEGADEIFGGYNLFREAKIRRFWAARPDSRLRPLLIQKLYPYIFRDKKKIAPFIQSFFGTGLDETDDPLFSHLLRWRNTSRIKIFFSDQFNQRITTDGDFLELRGLLPDGFASCGDLAQAQYLETTLFLSNYLLSSQGDRVAMAHGVEIRPPYLDHRLIEFMARVPAVLKIKGLNEKYLLKETLRDLLPEAVVNRPKHPYRAPIAPAFLKGPAAHLLEDLSEEPIKKAGLFDPGKTGILLRKLARNPQAGELDQMALAGLLSTQIIYRQFIQDFPWKPIWPVEPDLFVDKRMGRINGSLE